MEILPSIVIFLVLFALSAFFSGSEIALMSLPAHKIDSLVKQKKTGAKILKKLKEKNEKLLITILIGNNLVNVFTASFATKISLDVAVASGIEQSLAIGISTGVITLLLLLFGEIFPKTLATRNAEKISLFVAKIYQILGYIFYPVIVAIDGLMRLLHKGDNAGIEVSEEEIESFIDMGKESGVFEQGEYEKIKKMLDFYEVEAHEIMTPRVNIEALPSTLTIKEALVEASKYSHSRLPVYQGTVDKIERSITLREMIQLESEGAGEQKLKDIDLKKMIRIPLTQPIHKILEIMRKYRVHIVLVMDEYGGVAGLITLEDIMEEVFGDFKDESDKEETPIQKKGGEYRVQGTVRIDDVLEELNLEFEDIGLEEMQFEGETLTYFITTHLERFPEIDEEISFWIQKEDEDIKKNKLYIKVLSLDEKTIKELEIAIK